MYMYVHVLWLLDRRMSAGIIQTSIYCFYTCIYTSTCTGSLLLPRASVDEGEDILGVFAILIEAEQRRVHALERLERVERRRVLVEEFSEEGRAAARHREHDDAHWSLGWRRYRFGS